MYAEHTAHIPFFLLIMKREMVRMMAKPLVLLPGDSISASRTRHRKLRVWTGLGIYLNVHVPPTASSQRYLVKILVVMAPLAT